MAFDANQTVTIDDQSEPGSWIKAFADADCTQVGGDHYTSKCIQPWDAMQAWMTPEQFHGFLRANAIKYLARAGSKGDALEDYRKAQHYIAKLIEVVTDGA